MADQFLVPAHVTGHQQVERIIARRELAGHGRHQVLDGGARKGDVLGVARIAAIQGAKRASDLIPLAHPIQITRIAIDAVDDAGRTLAVVGDAVSRHWRGHGGDTLLRWQWDGHEGWGEDQSYYSRAVADAYKARAASRAVSG